MYYKQDRKCAVPDTLSRDKAASTPKNAKSDFRDGLTFFFCMKFEHFHIKEAIPMKTQTMKPIEDSTQNEA